MGSSYNSKWDEIFLATVVRTEMFDLTLCNHRTLNNLPLYFEWEQFAWLRKPLLVVLLLLAFFALRWLSQNKRWRRWLSSSRAILLLFCFTATLPLMFIVAAKGLVAFLPTDSGTVADAIVVLGRGGPFSEQRVNIAAELWQDRRAPMIFTSGNEDGISMIQQLKEKGIPNRVLDGENCSLTTEENAVLTTAILKQQGVQKILLITDPPHMLRSLLLFRAFGFTVIPRTSPLPSYLDFKTKAFITLREYMGIVGYGLRGQFLPQDSPELNRPNIVNIIQKAEQYGQQRRLPQEG
jgi:uncharacterized SAM-binding protein YcdF (DUF218 family)